MKQYRNLCTKKRKVIDRGKRTNSVENIKKNPQSFSEIRRMQTEVPPSHKMQDHAYDE